MTELRSESELTNDEIVEIAHDNHIWVNAFACIQPTDELCEAIGRQVINMLNDSPIEGDTLGVRIGKVLYVRLNKS